MFQDLFDLKTLAQEAMHNPGLALRNGLRRFPDKIREIRDDLVQLQQQLSTIEREAREREQENRRGWFGRSKEPGIFAMLGESLNGWSVNTLKSSITQREADLQHLTELAEELQQPFYSPGKTWTFVEVDQEINRLLAQLAGLYSAMEQASSVAMTTGKPLLEARTSAEDPWRALAENFKQVSAVSAALAGTDELLLRMCKLTVELDGLHACRRQLLSHFLEEIRDWEKRRIAVELQRRTRDLNELPSESEVIARQLSQLPVQHLSPEMIRRSPMYATFSEQRRFLEDLIFELQASVESATTTPKKSDATAEALDQIKELRRKMTAALANENDPDIRDDIKRAYGKKIDALRENL